MSAPNEIQVPASIADAAGAREILRAWAVGGSPHVVLRLDVWRKPEHWGLFLTDLARHVANGFESTGRMEAKEAFARIRAALDAEWSHPTTEVKGSHWIGSSGGSGAE